MNKSNINITKAFLTIIIFSLLALYSCKKDKDADTPFNPIAGVWQSTNSSDVKFYDVVTGAEKFNPGIDVSASGSITFEADGRYFAGTEKGTYKYNATTRILTLIQATGESHDMKVYTLDEHNLTVEASLISGNTKIVVIQSYIK